MIGDDRHQRAVGDAPERPIAEPRADHHAGIGFPDAVQEQAHQAPTSPVTSSAASTSAA